MTAAAAANPGVTVLTGQLPDIAGRHDVCLRFAVSGPDPIWAVDWVRIGGVE